MHSFNGVLLPTGERIGLLRKPPDSDPEQGRDSSSGGATDSEHLEHTHMPSRPCQAVGRICLALMLAITLALLSALMQRIGPEELPYGNLCGRSGSELCMEPVLNGGFPFPYLFDAPGVSRERQLAFVEDDLRTPPFLLNVVVYFFVVVLVNIVVALRLSRSKPHKSGNAP